MPSGSRSSCGSWPAPLARRGAEQLPPRVVAWALTVLAAVLAVSSTAALALLALAGALRLPFVATRAHLSPALLGDASPVTDPAAATAVVALTALCVLLPREIHRHLRELRIAREEFADVPHAGDLYVRQDDRPDAYALPGRPGRVVVTTGMLRALDAREREVLFAHERAHLAGRHHLFAVCAESAAALHPALRALRAPLSYALERWADESAARATGDRALTARAVGRAALAAHSASPAGPGPRPRFALGATAGPVPRRVAALLTAPARTRVPRGPLPRVLACLLLASVALSTAAALVAAADLHSGIEIAQGEHGLGEPRYSGSR
ncbi:M48 family metalloprotease [Streptomyces griseoviridis]|uniref:M56 family metallopeptidase n=1 Tax=Streptomyces TaxID=1883 RepID=UPI00247722C5|nr:M48 family metalloprotease [Streptomyces sp. MAA16]MDH6696945.1 Zn-dependent protease with chaperone function [Streptomyces sp. MAA16]